MHMYMKVFAGEEVHVQLDIDGFKVPVHDHAGEEGGAV